MNEMKILFIDRDGTLIVEPEDKQIDSLDKLQLMPYVIPALLQLKKAGYRFVMVTNQDGLGTPSFPDEHFSRPHEKILDIFSSQGIVFDAIHICPHTPSQACDCRKPKTGLLQKYLIERSFDRKHSYVIGDRETDIELASNLGIQGLQIGTPAMLGWQEIITHILNSDRMVKHSRKTNETAISLDINLDNSNYIAIQTGIDFFNHMLEQLAKHGGFSLSLIAQGDLHIDDHHTVEDVAIVLGEALRVALGDKWGIGRYGFVLPMDEAQAQVAIDLSGRAHFQFQGEFKREKVGDFSTELVTHFFRSFAESLKASIQIDVRGENTHHMVEAIFKGVGRSLRQAIARCDEALPSTKGVL